MAQIVVQEGDASDAVIDLLDAEVRERSYGPDNQRQEEGGMPDTFVPGAFPVPVPEDVVRGDHPGFSFGVFRDPPGQVWADFVHRQDEFVVVAEGTVEISVGRETRTCRPGDLVRIPAGARHTLKTSRDAGSVWLYGYGWFDARS